LFFVTVSDAFCSTTDSINLSLIPCNLAIADFTASQTSICENECVDFTDLSSYADTWQWSFPGANTTSSTDQHPANICYSVPGTYEVELLVTNSYGGNALTLTNYITVYANPPVPFVIVNGFWLSSSVASAGYQWFLNGNAIPGATLQSHSATADGYYHVVIDNGQGCVSQSDPVFVSITSLTEHESLQVMHLSPNPAKDDVSLRNLASDVSALQLYDMAGKMIWTKTIRQTNEVNFSTADLSNGIYMVRVISSTEMRELKLVISR
jgi:PKD repeat protein